VGESVAHPAPIDWKQIISARIRPAKDTRSAGVAEANRPPITAAIVGQQLASTAVQQPDSAAHRAANPPAIPAAKRPTKRPVFPGRAGVRDSAKPPKPWLERYTQARIGNVHAPETTGKFVAATFEHDTARPVDGYAAPQLHTHSVIFNMTERDNEQARALQERSLFQSQRYLTSVYRSELAMRLQKLGYEIETGKHGQPEIKGYTKEYLEASSPRRAQIKGHLQEIGLDGAGPAQVVIRLTAW